MSILFFDIDHTLLSHKTFSVPQSAQEALKRAKEREHILFLSSGRNRTAATQAFDTSIFDGVISGSGACSTFHGELLFSHPIDAADVEKILELRKKYQANISMQGIDDSWMDQSMIDLLSRLRSSFNYRKTMQVHEAEEYQNENICKIDMFFHADTDVENLIAGLPSSLHVCHMLSEMRLRSGCELTASGVNKGTGVKKTLEALGIDIKDSYGFGDSENDMELVAMCGTGIAMGNARQELKEAADYVTTDIEEDGIFNAMTHLGLI